MCNFQNEKIARIAKERDELKAENRRLREQLDKIVKCEECGHFIPKIWDCDLYAGAHKPDGYCDAGERM